MKKRKRTNKKYSAEFKVHVIMDMRENGLSYHETVRKYWQAKTRAEESNHMKTVKLWERIYLEEAAGLMESAEAEKVKADHERSRHLHNRKRSHCRESTFERTIGMVGNGE